MDAISRHKSEFEKIYLSYYSRMKRFAQEYVIREEDAENIVQDLFLDLWEQNIELLSHSNLFAYLFTSVKNRCIDFLRTGQPCVTLRRNYRRLYESPAD